MSSLTCLQDSGCLKKISWYIHFLLFACYWCIKLHLWLRMSIASLFSFSICQKQEKGLMSQNMVVISIHPFQKKCFRRKWRHLSCGFLKKVHFSTETLYFYLFELSRIFFLQLHYITACLCGWQCSALCCNERDISLGFLWFSISNDMAFKKKFK